MISNTIEKLKKKTLVSASSSGSINGHIDRLQGDVIHGWAYNPSTPNTPVALTVVDEAGNVYSVGEASTWRSDIADLGYNSGYCGFALQLTSREKNPEILILMSKSGIEIDRYHLGLQTNKKQYSLIKKDFAGAMSQLPGSPAYVSDEAAREEYGALLSKMRDERQWYQLKMALVDERFSKYKAEAALLLRDIFKEVMYLNCNDHIHYDSDMAAKLGLLLDCVDSNLGFVIFDAPFDVYPEHFENLVANILFYRPSADFRSLSKLIDRLWLNFLYDYEPGLEALFNQVAGVISKVPVLFENDSDVVLKKVCLQVVALNKKVPTRAFHTVRVRVLNYLKACLSNSAGRKALVENRDLIRNMMSDLVDFSESYGFKSVAALFDIDFSYVSEDQAGILTSLSALENYDSNLIIWNVRYLEASLYENMWVLDESVRKFAYKLLFEKFNIGRLGKLGTLLLINSFKRSLTSQHAKVDLFYLRELVLNASKYWSDSSLRKSLLAFTEMPGLNNSMSDIQERLRLIDYAESGRGMLSIESPQQPGLARIERDITGLLAKRNAIVGHSPTLKIFRNKSVTRFSNLEREIRVGIVSKGVDIPSEYFDVLRDVGTNMGMALQDAQGEVDVTINLNSKGMITPEFFSWLKDFEGGDVEFVSESGDVLGQLQWGESAEPKIVKVARGVFSIGRQGAEKCVLEHFGVVSVDDPQTLFSFYTLYYRPGRELKAISSGKDTIYALRADVERIFESECVAFIVQRNEKVRLKEFLPYYRNMGVSRFVVIDNYSDDGTHEFLLEQDDVDVFVTPQPYSTSRFGVDWIDLLVRSLRNGKWNLVLDPDEQLVFDGFQTIGELTSWMEEVGHDALYSPFIDVYPKGDMDNHGCSMSPELSESRLYHDENWFTVFNAFGGYCDLLPTFQGGVRSRVFGLNSVVLNKIPLFKFRPEMSLYEGVHWMDGCNPAYGQAVLLHHKYNELFSGYVKREAERGEHWNGGAEYKMYASMLAGESGLELYSNLESGSIESLDSVRI